MGCRDCCVGCGDRVGKIGRVCTVFEGEALCRCVLVGTDGKRARIDCIVRVASRSRYTVIFAAVVILANVE